MGPLYHARPLGPLALVGALVADCAWLDCHGNWCGGNYRGDPQGLRMRQMALFKGSGTLSADPFRHPDCMHQLVRIAPGVWGQVRVTVYPV